MELRDLEDMNSRSVTRETLAELMKTVHDQVKDHLDKLVAKYKDMFDKKKKEVHFKIGDLVMAFLNNDKLPKGLGIKLQMKRIGPCKILHKHGNNAYELELPQGLGVSHIFNVAYLTFFKGDMNSDSSNKEDPKVEWVNDLTRTKKL